MANGQNNRQQYGRKALTGLRAIFVSATLMGLSLTAVHAEDGADPTAVLTEKYNALEGAAYESEALHELVDELNQRVHEHPEDFKAWEMLAKIYDYYGDYDYAIYAASEAVNLGYRTDTLKRVLLSSSVSMARDQLQSGYQEGIDDQVFLKNYQAALSSIYGEVHTFNYDESLPKKVRTYRPKRSSRQIRRPPRVRNRISRATTRKASVKPSRTRSNSQPASRAKPVPPRSNPFTILGQ